jgi:tetratricopeptide (TPR) repeat protein
VPEEQTRTSSPRRTARQWIIPPGLTATGEPFEGFRVLEEVPGQLGVTLWQYARDVELWSTTPPETRHRLFVAGQSQRRRERTAALRSMGELRLPLLSLSRAIERRTHNAGAQVTRACAAVSRWAEDQGLPRTALAFAQSAALATPDQAGPALAVGVLARRAGEPRRAETWFRRALGLARRRHDWRYYGLASLGLGSVAMQRGDHVAARGWFVRALRISRRYALWDVRPLALHQLFTAAVRTGDAENAEAFAQRALKAYGAGHPRLVALAHDVAAFWLAAGRFDEALHAYRAVLPRVSEIVERRRVASGMARAAAGVGDRLTFATMWSETWRLVDEFGEGEGVAAALLALAEGAALLGDPDRGQMAAAHAHRIATQRDEAGVRTAAEKLMESLRTVRRGYAARNRGPAPPPEPPRPAPDFAAELVEALRVEPTETVSETEPAFELFL